VALAQPDPGTVAQDDRRAKRDELTRRGSCFLDCHGRDLVSERGQQILAAERADSIRRDPQPGLRVQTLSRPSPQVIRPVPFQDLERCRLARSVGEQCKRDQPGHVDRWRTSRPGLI
jgi:hypothetical protein